MDYGCAVNSQIFARELIEWIFECECSVGSAFANTDSELMLFQRRFAIVSVANFFAFRTRLGLPAAPSLARVDTLPCRGWFDVPAKSLQEEFPLPPLSGGPLS